MTLDDAIEFIVLKMDLVAAHVLTESNRKALQDQQAALDALWQHPRLSLQQLRDFDGELLEKLIDHDVPDADEAKIREQLLAQFKTSRLRPPDRKIARRVLKRGRIADLEEYYAVKEYVSNVDHIDEIGDENYQKLDALLGRYDGPDEEMAEPTPIPPPAAGKRPSRRRPPPPFDFTLVDDEKLCSPDTPFETRLAFVEAKHALVMQHLKSPQARDGFALALKWGLERVLGPSVPSERRNQQLEWLEHEAEFFAGYEVGGATHRAIEDELERRFGFRRLGPSAQERLRRLLASNDASGAGNPLFIERFIYAYPHQTLFTAAEIRRAEKLLKAPRSA